MRDWRFIYREPLWLLGASGSWAGGKVNRAAILMKDNATRCGRETGGSAEAK